MAKMDTNVHKKIDIKIKELLELINKKSENELILRDFEIYSLVTVDDSNVLNTKYNISFTSVLTEKKWQLIHLLTIKKLQKTILY